MISGYSSSGSLAPVRMALAFSVITPPERLPPPFCAGVLGAEGFILMNRFVRIVVIIGFMNSLLHFTTLGDIWYCFSRVFKKWLIAGLIDSDFLLVR